MIKNNIITKEDSGYKINTIEILKSSGEHILNDMYSVHFNDLKVLRKYIEVRPDEKFYVSKKLSKLEIETLKEFGNVR